jgi:hypothetical protein
VLIAQLLLDLATLAVEQRAPQADMDDEVPSVALVGGYQPGQGAAPGHPWPRVHLGSTDSLDLPCDEGTLGEGDHPALVALEHPQPGTALWAMGVLRRKVEHHQLGGSPHPSRLPPGAGRDCAQRAQELESPFF